MGGKRGGSLSSQDYVQDFLGFLEGNHWKPAEIEEVKEGIRDKGGTWSYVKDGGGDSLDSVEFIMWAEEHYGIELPDDEIGDLENIRDSYELICKKLGARPDSAFRYTF